MAAAAVEEDEEEDEEEMTVMLGGPGRGSRTISGSERAPRAREAKRVAQRGRRGVQRAL